MENTRTCFSRCGGLLSLLAIIPLGVTLGGCASNGGRGDDGFGMGVGRDPTPHTLHMMARLLDERGRPDKAEWVLTSVLREHGTYAPVAVELAEIMHRQGRVHDAIDTLRTIEAAGARDPVVMNNLGVLLLEAGDAEAARGAFIGAVRTDPAEARYRCNLAIALAMLGAVETAESVLATTMPAGDAAFNVAIVLDSIGDASAAIDQYTRAASLDPSIDVQPELARLNGIVSTDRQTPSPADRAVVAAEP